MWSELAVLVLYLGFSVLICLGLRALTLSHSSVLDIFAKQARPGFRLPRRPLHVVRGRGETMAMIAACLVLTILLTLLIFWLPAVIGAMARAGIALRFSGLGLSVSYADLPHVAGRLPWVGLALVATFAAGSWVSRDTLAFPFFAIHLGLALLGVLVDLLFDAPVGERGVVIQRALTTAYVFLLASLAFFASIARPGLRGAVLMLLSTVVSAVAFVLGTMALAVIGAGTTETTLMFVTYLVIAYGIVLQHVAGVSLALSEG